MAKIRIARAVLDRTRKRSNLTRGEKARIERLLGDGTGPISVDVGAVPRAFLKALLDDEHLSTNQRALIMLRVHGMPGGSPDRDRIYDTAVTRPADFGALFLGLGSSAPNCEVFMNGRWYPITLKAQVVPLYDEGRRRKATYLSGQFRLCEQSYPISFRVYPEMFLDETGRRIERTVRDILNEFQLRPLQTSPGDFNLKLIRTERLAREHGKVVLVSGPVMIQGTYSWWGKQPESRALGTLDSPRKCVIEPEIEVVQEEREYYSHYGQTEEGASRLPFVRVFSLDTKSYAYADVDDVAPYEFDTQAMSRLHLPAPMLNTLSTVFNTPMEGVFGDVVRGKHGGVVILACGKPGVGKTLTAEVYAEQTQRPLYVLELGELGTSVTQVEENLQKVFRRVARWNAVLQFDECEIFLSKRGDDLERSAIVGSFLRLLDYYQGILFLTTNRAEVLDHAVLSRVMLRLEYPELDKPARAAIWRTMLTAAEMKLTDGSIEQLAETDINGRQIRNLTRLAKIMHPAGELGLGQMREVLSYGCST